MQKPNSFNDNTKIGVITAVYPDKKTVDIKYTSQAGKYDNLNLPYNVVGLTWGILYMPIKGDKVLIDMTNSSIPVIKGMYAPNTSLLPYLDPGEFAFMSENGSYIHLKNQRKRAISEDSLLDYDATQGPKGATDIQYEPSGIIFRVRTKKNRDQVAPRWDLHSSLSMYDNGDITLESMQNEVPKAMLHMNGDSGYLFMAAGNGMIQEYIEMNPLKKELLIFTDGEFHKHVQTNQKENVLGNLIQYIGGGILIKVGVNLEDIPADFDQINSSDIGIGDIYIDNASTSGSGNATLKLKGNFNIIVNGDTNITSIGSTQVNSSQDITLNSQAGVHITAGSGVFIGEGNDPVVTQSTFEIHTHKYLSNNQPLDSTVPTTPFFNRNIFG